MNGFFNESVEQTLNFFSAEVFFIVLNKRIILKPTKIHWAYFICCGFCSLWHSVVTCCYNVVILNYQKLHNFSYVRLCLKKKNEFEKKIHKFGP